MKPAAPKQTKRLPSKKASQPEPQGITAHVCIALDSGFAVFPLIAREKTPACKHGFKDASSDPATVKPWFVEHPDNNYGIATGEPSGIFVLDVDGYDGSNSLRNLTKEYGKLPITVKVATDNGQHYYFRHPGQPVQTNAGRIGPGLDIRGDGGYVVGAGSTHPSGHIYS